MSLLSTKVRFSEAENLEAYEHRRAERWTALNYASHYPFSRSKARSQQQAQSHTTKIMNQVCFHGQERRVQYALPRFPGRLFPQ